MTITSRPPNLPLFATFLLIFLRCVHCTANTTQLRWTTLERQVFSFSNDSDGTTTLLQNNTRSIVSSWDLDRNGLISRDEFNQAMSHSLISEDRSWFRRLWDKFRSHRQTQNLDILWWSIVQKPQSNYTQQANAVDQEQMIQFLQQGFRHPFPLVAEPCTKVFKHIQEFCVNPRDVQSIMALGNEVSVMNEYCRRGFSGLTNFVVEKCVLASHTCSQIRQCFEHDSSVGRVRRRIGFQVLLWSIFDSLVLSNASSLSNSTSEPVCQDAYNRISVFMFEKENIATNASESITVKLPTFAETLQDYQSCINGSSIAYNLTYERCLVDSLPPSFAQPDSNHTQPNDSTSFATQRSLASCLQLRPSAKSASNNASPKEELKRRSMSSHSSHLQKRNVFLLAFFGFFGPLAFILCMATVAILSLPIAIPIYLSHHAKVTSKENAKNADKIWVLLPAGSEEIPAEKTCKESILYWGGCGLIGTDAARSCPDGGVLRYDDSCNSYWNFNPGSMICSSEGNNTVPSKKAQYSNTAQPSQTAQESLWSRTKAVMMGPFRYQCRSLCVKYLPDGCLASK